MTFASTKSGTEPTDPPPRHIAVIMDGNGRWAKQRGLPRSFGHRQGVEAARRAVRAARELGVQYLTLYGFSSENWKRPPEEVGELMGLLRFFVRSDLADLDANDVRIRIIGERRGLAADIVSLLEEAEGRTRHNSGLTLIIAFNYGGQDEIARAARALAYDVACGALDPAAVTTETLAARLDTRDVPNPDLVIRTSGEQRLSNFLVWQCAYAELAFLDVYWPDFSRNHLAEAIAEYHRRERRFGAVEPAKRA